MTGSIQRRVEYEMRARISQLEMDLETAQAALEISNEEEAIRENLLHEAKTLLGEALGFCRPDGWFGRVRDFLEREQGGH